MFQGKVILVVDDEADLREILRDELVYEGATVFEAANGLEAIDQLSKRKFDAVLSDIRMPGGDGATLARQIRRQDSSHPVVILITGFADLYVEEAYDLGADGYVTKPFHLDELKLTLHRLLKSPHERWHQSMAKPSQKLTCPWTLDEALRQGHLHLGRGGFFLQIEPEQLRAGDLVEVCFSQAQPIQALVRWVRTDRNDSQRPGLGLEFTEVPAMTFEHLQQIRPQWQAEKSFIPKL